MSSPEENGEKRRPDSVGPHGWFRMYAAVLEFLAYLAVFGYLGNVLEKRYGWEPWGLLCGLLLGMAWGLYRMLKEAKRLGL